MRNLSLNGYKCDKKYLLAVGITFVCAIISGIVLYKIIGIGSYFKNFADDYVYYVFNFKNGSLIFSHIFSELLYLYAFFIIAYFVKIKYLTLIVAYIRCIFIATYTIILVSTLGLGGIIVAVFVFLPTALISLALCCATAELCRCVNGRFAVFLPLVFAVANTVVLVLLVNVVFRFIIIIV